MANLVRVGVGVAKMIGTEALRMADDVATSDRIAAILAAVDYAFQPIVNVHTGVSYAYEALMRGHEAAGYASIRDLLDAAHADGFLVDLDRGLYEMAIAKFAQFGPANNARLFLNLDNRLLSNPNYRPAAMGVALRRFRLSPSMLCVEISEVDAVVDPAKVRQMFQFPLGNAQVAIDDFGVGHSGLHLLCTSHPDLIKVDRFFIAGIDTDVKKKVFLSSIVTLARSLGIWVIAEGVETEAEFRVCREIGCDLVQGYFVARPTTSVAALLPRYEVVTAANRNDRRERHDTSRLVRAELDRVAPIDVNAGMERVLETFRRDKTRSFFPVVDDQMQPVGILHEVDLKEFVYSPFGKDLLVNKGKPYRLRGFVKPCLVCDVNAPIDRILASFAIRDDEPAVIIVDEGRYLGLLQASALVRLMNEHNLMVARNQNPLTKLPGNNSIADYLATAFEDHDNAWCFAYFDLDNFKPFNDRFGFRQGDRAILLFADLLRQHFSGRDFFIGHIGGDDFFMAARNLPATAAEQMTARFLERFAADAANFYDAETRALGYITAPDRHDGTKQIPLLAASCALLNLPLGPRMATPDSVSATLADLKKLAKASPAKLVQRTLA
jgi:diguanylate cyclase (GGDEF)-like protein